MKIKGSEKITVKPAFEERYKKLLGKDYEEFLEYSLSYPNRSIRTNTLKITVNELQKRLKENWNLKEIPWCKEGFWISGERRDIGNLTEHMLGYFYVQEAASMIPPQVLNPTSEDIVLDMCAAPGSKTTQIASKMQNKGILIANDQKGIRLKALGLNLQRAGVTNTVITLMNGASFKNKNINFTKILLDAPCSGTGTIRKSLKTIQDWNPNAVKRLAATQRALIEAAFQTIQPGGEMVYSTCSLEPEENESVVSSLIKKYETAKIQKINFEGKRAEPFIEFEKEQYGPELKKTLRLWPQNNDTDGFYVAKIKKEE